MKCQKEGQRQEADETPAGPHRMFLFSLHTYFLLRPVPCLTHYLLVNHLPPSPIVMPPVATLSPSTPSMLGRFVRL